MSFSNPLKFTNAGREVQLQTLTGKPLTFTTVRMGDGELSSAISVMTSLINERVSVAVNTAVANSQYATIEAIFKNTDLTAGFYWRELGVYVADPNDPNNRDSDILYAYQNAGEYAEYINSPGSSVIEKIIRIPVFVGESSAVSLSMNTIVHQEATITQTETVTIADDDYLTIYDSLDQHNKKMKYSSFKKEISKENVEDISSDFISQVCVDELSYGIVVKKQGNIISGRMDFNINTNVLDLSTSNYEGLVSLVKITDAYKPSESSGVVETPLSVYGYDIDGNYVKDVIAMITPNEYEIAVTSTVKVRNIVLSFTYISEE